MIRAAPRGSFRWQHKSHSTLTRPQAAADDHELGAGGVTFEQRTPAARCSGGRSRLRAGPRPPCDRRRTQRPAARKKKGDKYRKSPTPFNRGRKAPCATPGGGQRDARLERRTSYRVPTVYHARQPAPYYTHIDHVRADVYTERQRNTRCSTPEPAMHLRCRVPRETRHESGGMTTRCS